MGKEEKEEEAGREGEGGRIPRLERLERVWKMLKESIGLLAVILRMRNVLKTTSTSLSDLRHTESIFLYRN